MSSLKKKANKLNTTNLYLNVGWLKRGLVFSATKIKAVCTNTTIMDNDSMLNTWIIKIFWHKRQETKSLQNMQTYLHHSCLKCSSYNKQGYKNTQYTFVEAYIIIAIKNKYTMYL